MPLILPDLDNDLSILSGLARLFLACFLCGLIGLERESKNKPVGYKTCVIISITSCLLTLISIQSALYYADFTTNIRTDPMRLAAQVISGVGFLGAGVILLKSNQIISGLTTASIIWSAAGIGITCGAGFYLYASIATLMILVIVKLSNVISRISNKLSRYYSIDASVHVTSGEAINTLLNYLRGRGYNIDSVNIMDNKKNRVEIRLQLSVENKTGMFVLYSTLKELDYVYSVSLSH